MNAAAGRLAIEVEVFGVKQLSRVMAVSLDAVKDLRPAWWYITEDFVKREQTVFTRQGAVQGWAKWKPLNPEYLAWKKANGWSPKIMVQGGRTAHSLTDRKAADFIEHMTPKSLEIGTRVPYAHFHQKPGDKSRNPKREVIRVTENQKKFWIKTIQAFIVKSGQFKRNNIV